MQLEDPQTRTVRSDDRGGPSCRTLINNVFSLTIRADNRKRELVAKGKAKVDAIEDLSSGQQCDGSVSGAAVAKLGDISLDGRHVGQFFDAIVRYAWGCDCVFCRVGRLVFERHGCELVYSTSMPI